MSWNHRLIKMRDGSIILAEVYYAEDGSPSMYSDCRDVFYCEPTEEPDEAWKEQRAQYESAFTKLLLDEMLFEQETGFAESLADVMQKKEGEE